MASPYSYMYSLKIGIPGEAQAGEWSQIEECLLAAVGFPTAYGVPVKIAAGVVSGIQASGDTTPAATPFGWIVRPYPRQGLTNEALAVSAPPTSGMVNILVRGYISVFLQDATTVAKGDAVWIRSAATSGTKLFGGVQSTTDGATTTKITNNTYFMGPADASGNAVVAVNI